MQRPVRLAVVAAVFSSALSASACFLANAGADKKIDSAVQNLNDQARWGRIQDAMSLVQPEYRERFAVSHRGWGADIQVADSEVLNIQLTSDAKKATSVVSYSWYAMADMTLHETTLRQVWNARKSSFVLAGEVVIKGDAALLGAR